jgi:glyoxylase-like metal-dependent hydrolase (beta-lactamase superfamily II)
MDATSRPVSQPSSVQHTTVGDAVVSVVNDGVLLVSFDDLVTTDRAACERSQGESFRATPPWLTINCFLIRSGGTLALVDAGYARETEDVGKLVANLGSIGIEPGDIDAILMTHMHPDHEAGLTDGSGRAIFPKAELILHEDELAFWRDDAAMSQATGSVLRDFGLARAALAAYEGRIRSVTKGEALPRVFAYPTPGHTPGHTAWLVQSDGDSLLIWGDIIHHPGVQFALPDTSVAYDIDPVAAAEARKKVLRFAAGEGLRVAGVHLDFPAFGHIVANAGGYRFIPDVWRPAL